MTAVESSAVPVHFAASAVRSPVPSVTVLPTDQMSMSKCFRPSPPALQTVLYPPETASQRFIQPLLQLPLNPPLPPQAHPCLPSPHPLPLQVLPHGVKATFIPVQQVQPGLLLDAEPQDPEGPEGIGALPPGAIISPNLNQPQQQPAFKQQSMDRKPSAPSSRCDFGLQYGWAGVPPPPLLNEW